MRHRPTLRHGARLADATRQRALRACVVLCGIGAASGCRSDSTVVGQEPVGSDSSDTGESPDAPGPVGTLEQALPCDLASGWCAGDDLPGWEDFDYEEYWQPPDYATVITLPQSGAWVWIASCSEEEYGPDCDVDPLDPGDFSSLGAMKVWLGDCERWDCAEVYAGGPPHALFSFWPQLSADGDPLSLGCFESDHPCGGGGVEPRLNALFFNVPDDTGAQLSAECTDDALWTNVEAGVCFGRVRPDELSGVLYFDVPATTTNWTFGDRYYVLPFTVRFPEHGGVYGASLPSEMTRQQKDFHYYYGPDYDLAWPWGDIVDPEVMAFLHDRYTPFDRVDE